MARKAKVPRVVGVIWCAELEIELALRGYHDSWNICQRRHSATPGNEVKSRGIGKLAVKVNKIWMMLLCELKSGVRILETLHTKLWSNGM